MPTVPLPHEPDLEQLKRQARELQRAVRAGDRTALASVAEYHPRGVPADVSAFPLTAAQLVIARRHGFASWMRLRAHLEVVARFTRRPDVVEPAPRPADEFLRLACLTYGDDDPDRWRAARALLADESEIGRDIFTAAVVADVARVDALLARDRELARRDGGPFGWQPLFYLAYARHDPALSELAVLETARLLLRHGADPNAGYLWHGLPTPFTVLTGIFGEGEGGPVRQPRHPHALALARVVLEAGADPNDGQTLYNRMFEPANDHLALLFEYGLGTGDGGPWRARLGDALESPPELLRAQLQWAIVHDLRARVELLADHGVDLDEPFADGSTPRALAARNGRPALVALLDARGAAAADLDPSDVFIGAALAADRDAVERLRLAQPDVVDEVRRARPGLVVWAAALGRAQGVAVLVELGFDVNARGRGDVPVEEPWETALHQAVANGDADLVALLLRLGADPNVEDARFASTPLGWAHRFDRPALAAILEPLTTQTTHTGF